jgi:hypothetical protein
LAILFPFRAAGSAFMKSMRPDAATADDPGTPTVFEIPFDSERKPRAGDQGGSRGGAALLHLRTAGGRSRAAHRRRQILAASTALADGALRVLSLVPMTIIEVVKYFFTPAP